MKTYAVKFTPRAERQLADLYRFIAEQSGEARADAYIHEIVSACRSLSTFPARGTKRDEVRANLRTLGFARRVTIAFSIDANATAVAIHGVFYGGQDFEMLLRDSEIDD